MTAAAAAATLNATGQSETPQRSGIAANLSVPVGGMEPARKEAIKKVMSFASLRPDWDGQGSQAPSLCVRQTAIDLLLELPGELPVPRVVPVSGGGYHFEWSMGDRELELSIEPDDSSARCVIEALRVEHGAPIEPEEFNNLSTFFAWLSYRI